MRQDDTSVGPEVRALAQSLLDSAASDAPSPELHRSVAVAVGLGTAAATSIAQSAELGTVTSALGASIKSAPLWALGKWAAGGFLVASVAVGSLHGVERMSAPSEHAAPASRARVPSGSRAAGANAQGRSAAPAAAEEPPEDGLAVMPSAALAPEALRGPAASTTSSGPGSESGRGVETEPQSTDRVPDGEHKRAFVAAEDEPPAVPSSEPAVPSSEPGPDTPSAGVGSFSRAPQNGSTSKRLGDQLAGEVRLLDAARVHAAAGRLGPALAALNQYHSSYPTGVLRAEALALTVDLWLQAGKEPEARRWLQVLERAFPTSQHLERFTKLRSRLQPNGASPR